MPYTDSASAEVSLPILGVWLHDPTAIQESVRPFLYGAGQRSDGLDTLGVSSFFVGRTAPVVEFGEFEVESVEAVLDVPHGETYAEDLSRLREFSAMKAPIWYRDNRGRALYGWISSFKVNDEEWGVSVSITVTRAHRDVEQVAS